MAIVVGNRISPLLAPASGVAALLLAVSLIGSYDAVAIRRHGISLRSRERARKLRALVVALLAASLTAAVIFLL